MAKQVNIEVILLKSLRHLLKKPDTTIWWGRRLPGWQLVFSIVTTLELILTSD
jgi:hypothetical protein